MTLKRVQTPQAWDVGPVRLKKKVKQYELTQLGEEGCPGGGGDGHRSSGRLGKLGWWLEMESLRRRKNDPRGSSNQQVTPMAFPSSWPAV